MTNLASFNAGDLSRIIEMAWEDDIPFEAIQREYGLNETGVILLMRNNLKQKSFKLWRKRVTGRKTKHLILKTSRLSATEHMVEECLCST